MGKAGGGIRWASTLLALMLLAPVTARTAAKPRAVLIVPFDVEALADDERWLGEGVADVLRLALVQHPAFVEIDRARVRALGHIEAWGEPVVTRAARSLRADDALYGRVARQGTDVVIQPRLLEIKPQGAETIVLEPIIAPDAELLARLATLPGVYARTMKLALTEADAQRMEKAAQPTHSLRAFELFARAQMAAERGGQENAETAIDLMSRAIEADPNFVVAQYTLGTIHQAVGNRWKAAAQYRAATQLDATYPEPYKALGDLFLAAPRRLFDQAVEAYTKAIELRPFYADAHVGLGDARAAKGDVDGAIAAYQKALSYDAMNAKVHMSLGRIYYAEKGLYYESVNAYKRAIELDPTSVDARMGLGDVYEDKGLYTEAIDEYKRVLELDDKHTGAMYNLAVVYEKVDPREAIAQWERYIEVASQLPSEKDWVDTARQHLRKLKAQHKE